MINFENKIIIVILLFLTVLVINSGVLASNSLWTDEKSTIYEDRPDFTEGDIVTVVIDEAASALQGADTETRQSTSIEGGSGSGLLNFFSSIGLNFSDEDTADGSTRRHGNFEANITTQVVEVMENGNLKVEGEKKVVINQEEQIISLSGIIRPDDIEKDNTVNSKKVAESNIQYTGQGPIAHRQNPSIFNWLFGWIF